MTAQFLDFPQLPHAPQPPKTPQAGIVGCMTTRLGPTRYTSDLHRLTDWLGRHPGSTRRRLLDSPLRRVAPDEANALIQLLVDLALVETEDTGRTVRFTMKPPPNR